MPALFFGSSEAPLYGVFHPPARRPARQLGVLIAPGLANEHVSAHRSLARLAAALADEGFPVLRYDHPGTGDSAGELDTIATADLRAGLTTAAEELLDMAGVSRLAVVGHRLGAWLASEAAARLDWAGIAMWDPVLDGQAYVDLLEREGHRSQSPAGALWVHGFPWSFSLLDELRREVVPAPSIAEGCRTMVIAADPEELYHGGVRGRLTGRPEATLHDCTMPRGIDLIRAGTPVVAEPETRATLAFLRLLR